MDIKKREDKIKEKRKQTPYRDYIKEIASWFSVVLHKKDGLISRYPENGRVKKVILFNDFHQTEDQRLKN